MNKDLESKLIVGAKIKIGKKYAEYSGSKEGDILELVEGSFDNDNGLYSTIEYAPAIFQNNDFDSIYHLFGNNLEDFMDCEILN